MSLSEEISHNQRRCHDFFPAWPKDQDASFTNLRVQGGFLVSAEQKACEIVKVKIASTIGGKLRLLNPWTGKIVERESAGYRP